MSEFAEPFPESVYAPHAEYYVIRYRAGMPMMDLPPGYDNLGPGSLAEQFAHKHPTSR